MRTLFVRMVSALTLLIAGSTCSVAGAVSPQGQATAERMACEFQRIDRTGNGSTGEVNIQITDEFLLWFEPSVLVRPETRAGYEGLRYKILERNEVGIVAARSSAISEADIGDVLNARVLTIKRSDGSLRIGSTRTAGAVDLGIGHCK